MDDELIRLEAVGRTFRSADIEVHALRRADLRIRRGDYLSIVGSSGSGKSTLLNIIALLDRHTSGTYRFEGTDVNELSEAARTGLRAHRIGFIFQSFHLIPHRTVTENVMMSMLSNSVRPKDRRIRAQAALDRVRLGHRARFLPVRLSGGERQRVAIARAIVTDPAILICDKPTGNLDSANTESILELFTELRFDGQTLLVVTHDGKVSSHADRRLAMHDGVLTERVPG